MLRITIESHRHDERTAQWIIDLLKFKSVPFKKHVIILPQKHKETLYQTVFERVERDDSC